MRFTSEYRSAGFPCAARPVIDLIVSGQVEMTWFTSPLDAAERVLASIETEDRLELCYWTDEGDLLGIAILREDLDDHVGLCLSVQWRWVHVHHRGLIGRGLQRQIIRTAKGLGHKVLAYTKTIAPGRYELTYLPLEKRRGQESQESIQEGRPVHRERD